jgi:hypothetical protein
VSGEDVVKKTINRDNWSGQTITIFIDEKTLSFQLPGLGIFYLAKRPDGLADETMTLDIYDIIGAVGGDFDGHKLGTVSDMTWHGKRQFEASAMGMTREGEDLYSAATKLLCNII